MTDTQIDKAAELTILVIAAFALLPLGAFTVQCLWWWFIVPLGAPEIGLVHAFGLSLCYGYARRHKVKEPPTASAFISENLATALVYLSFGWMASWLM